MPSLGQLFLEGAVVFDDAVVYDQESTGTVGVGVGILSRGFAVGSPARVADSGMPFGHPVPDASYQGA